MKESESIENRFSFLFLCAIHIYIDLTVYMDMFSR